MSMIMLMFLGWDDDRNKQTGKRGYVTEKVMYMYMYYIMLMFKVIP